MVNVAIPSLGLKLAPRSDNAVQLSLFRQIGGLVAALAGLLGGVLLSKLPQSGKLSTLEVFGGLFLVSGIGRAAAAFWFVGSEPQVSEVDSNPPGGRSQGSGEGQPKS